MLRRRRWRPLVSLILCTKNGMPYVEEALASVRALMYDNFEVVVQDAASTDGTAECLMRNADINMSVVSEPDSGIGDAFNRALSRCRGDVIGSIDADNLLDPRALDVAIAALALARDSAALYGAVTMLTSDGSPTGTFTPEPYDARAVMRCELVPPFSTSFFVREACGDQLWFDERLETCADYDLWLRLPPRRIERIIVPIGSTRISAKSMSQDPRRFAQFCADKLSALERCIDREPELAGERDASIAGIYCWAAECVLAIEGPTDRASGFLARAADHDPTSARVARLADAMRASMPTRS